MKIEEGWIDKYWMNIEEGWLWMNIEEGWLWMNPCSEKNPWNLEYNRL